MQKLPQALATLAAYQQFMLYKKVPSTDRPGKTDKFPCDIYGQVVSAHDPQYWISADQAIGTAMLHGEPYGVAFVFTKNDPFFFLDIDDCADNGKWSDTANSLMAMFPGAAIEVSQSGKGLHIFGRATHIEHAKKNASLNAELYTEARFVALTGNCNGDANVDCTAGFNQLVNMHFQPKAASAENWTVEPVAEYTHITDAVLIKKALSTKSAGSVFGGQAAFKDLWENDEAVLVGVFPDEQGLGGVDGSRADAALAQHLAFWTGNNCDRMLKLMNESALARPKWDRDDYLQRTILKAVGMQDKWYTGGKREAAPATHIEGVVTPDGKGFDITRRDGYQYLGPDQQIEYFKDCVYIQDVHRIVNLDGFEMKPEMFNAVYGGYDFQIDSEGRKKTDKAWDAFTKSQMVDFPQVRTTVFRPLTKDDRLIEENGIRMVNKYHEIITPRIKGDASPFLNHLAKLLPDERDRTIMLSYMAACIQHKGVKFQWAPLIQGAEGNGKTLLTRCVAYAISKQYTHLPKASEIAEKFNGWLVDKLFIGVEDIYVPDHKREIMEILKPMITSDEQPIRGMNATEITKDVYANFIFNSNYRDAVRKTRNDRRFSIFYTAQQCAEDIIRDGMGGNYFPELYKWLKTGGYAVVNDYLCEYEIQDEFNPTVDSMRAPITSSTNEAITESLGMVEQRIIQAIEEQRYGFAGGWVSGKELDDLIDRSAHIPLSKRRAIMQELGWDWHPGLTNGRVNNPINGARIRLYIPDGHINGNITSPAEIAKQYESAQKTAASPFGARNAQEAFSRG